MSDNNAKNKKKINKKAKLFLRIAISIILLIFFASKVNLNETLSMIANTNYIYLALGLLLYFVGQTISAYKWSIIAATIGFKRKFSEYLQFYFIGMFFNLFLPSTVGGDVGKAYYLSKGESNGRKAPAIYTVLAERMSGLAVLAWLGTIALLTPMGSTFPATLKYIAIALSLSILIGAPLFPIVMKKIFSENNWLNRSMMNDVMVFWNTKLTIQCLGLSLIFHLIIILIHILISLALHLDISPWYYFAIYPIVAIIGFIPIAFNGIGVREGAYIYLLSHAGAIESGAGLAFGILWFSIIVAASLVGGIVYIKGHHTPPPEDYEAPGLNLNELTNPDNSDKQNINDSKQLISN
ncbi:MAG: lysylphosphatidylglycerol synthase transmembrane domain-containing protein [Vampirovibrionia bacterium]